MELGNSTHVDENRVRPHLHVPTLLPDHEIFLNEMIDVGTCHPMSHRNEMIDIGTRYPKLTHTQKL